MSGFLDYAEYLEDSREYARRGPLDEVQLREDKAPQDPSNFFAERGWCPFCRRAAPVVHTSFHGGTMGGDLLEFTTIWECATCGWWQHQLHFIEEKDLLEEVDQLHWEWVKHAVVRRYNTAPHETAIAELVREVTGNVNMLHQIEPRKLEQIAQYVFSALYQCNVMHVGRSHDGGVDLIVVESDDPILVQVKRRASPSAAESVSTVREFVGAMYLQDARKGVVLSTARKFSREARMAGARALTNRKFDILDLVDFDHFCEMLGVVKRQGGEDFSRGGSSWYQGGKELLKNDSMYACIASRQNRTTDFRARWCGPRQRQRTLHLMLSKPLC